MPVDFRPVEIAGDEGPIARQTEIHGFDPMRPREQAGDMVRDLGSPLDPAGQIFIGRVQHDRVRRVDRCQYDGIVPGALACAEQLRQWSRQRHFLDWQRV